ncbi:afmd-1 [Pristionchus pacificus]|uniref:Afmd-1 n=1 Tax=Pristionchus pacificus TaxID=54126 RepID=A0A2A6CD03_PRIPA|nr:afmd-1 [Pristionchus pacificus]|eukprot:PDM76074.1 afmd-1 [Pristionchus pacificus]
MCEHDPSFTETDCLYSPSHWSVDGKTPKEVIDRFIAVLFASQARVKSITPSVWRTISMGAEESSYLSLKDGISSLEDSSTKKTPAHDRLRIPPTEGSRSDVAPLLEPLLEDRITVASVGYKLASPNRPLSALVYDVAGYIEKILSLFPNTGRIVVGGHSAGAHLAFKCISHLQYIRACRLAHLEKSRNFKIAQKGRTYYHLHRLPCALIKSPRITGLALVAGIFDLTELSETVIGMPIGMTAADAAESSCRAEEYSEGELEVLILVGECDTPRFRSQAADLHEQLRARKIKSQRVELPNEDHYSLIEGFAQETRKQTKLLRKFCSIQSL